MTEASALARVTVDELGGMTVVGGPDSLLGLVEVKVEEGLTVLVDPLDPSRFVGLSCADQERLQWLLVELLGPLPTALSPEGEVVAGPVEITVQPAALLAEIGRVGLLLWLQAHSPLNLSEDFLAIDLAVAYDAIPGSTALERTVEYAQAALYGISQAGARLRNNDAEVHVAAAAVLTRAATVAFNSLPDLSQEQVDSLNAARIAADAVVAAHAAVQDLNNEWSTGLLLPTAAMDWAARLAEAGKQESRIFSVDWRVVPRGVLDLSEGTIVGRWDRNEPTRVDVTVAGLPGAPASGALMIRVLRGPSGYQVATCLLDYAGLDYHGEVIVPGGIGDQDRIDVFSVLATKAPLRSPDEVNRAAGVRCAGRGFSTMRLATALPQESAESLWRGAAAHWSEWIRSATLFSPTSASLGRDMDVAHACWIRCLERLGSESTVRRIAGRIGNPAHVPKWHHPSAGISFAELGLLGGLAN